MAGNNLLLIQFQLLIFYFCFVVVFFQFLPLSLTDENLISLTE